MLEGPSRDSCIVRSLACFMAWAFRSWFFPYNGALVWAGTDSGTGSTPSWWDSPSKGKAKTCLTLAPRPVKTRFCTCHVASHHEAAHLSSVHKHASLLHFGARPPSPVPPSVHTATRVGIDGCGPKTDFHLIPSSRCALASFVSWATAGPFPLRCHALVSVSFRKIADSARKPFRFSPSVIAKLLSHLGTDTRSCCK